MRPTTRTRRGLTTLALASAVLLSIATGGRADDTDLFTARVAPNVMFLVDNSGSMMHVVWHPVFRKDFVYDPVTCPYVADPTDPAYKAQCLQYPLCPISSGDSEFVAAAGTSWEPEGLETAYGATVNYPSCTSRDVFAVNGSSTSRPTYWDVDYLRWYFSQNVEVDHDGDGTTILNEILATQNGDYSACLRARTWPDHYDKYRRSRSQAAEDILNEVICQTSQMVSIRFGIAKFYGSRWNGWDYYLDPAGGYVALAIDDYDPAHATALENAIAAVKDITYTPLSESLYNVYRYFMSRNSSKMPLGQDGVTPFDVYNLNDSSGSVPGHPVTEDCQLNFVIVVTDGEPTADDFNAMNLARFRNLIGDYNTPSPDETEEVGVGSSGPPWTGRVTYYLDDIAKFMHENDFMLEDAFPSQQIIDVYTVGFTTNATANAYLQKTATVGGGEFFKSNNPEELSQALASAIASISAKARSFTAATVPSSRATDGNNFFTSYFVPAKQSPFWEGHLKLFEFNAKGEIRDEPTSPGVEGECALADPQAPAVCRQGALKLALDGYWDAANEIPAPGSRNLYVSKYQASPPGTIPATPQAFTEANISATDLGVNGAGAAEIVAYNLPLPGYDTSGITTDEQLADAIVRYVRGCEFHSGSCVDRGDGNKLWDIFHSSPVVVGPPNAALREATYREFVRRYKHRKRVIYAGSNGGFVHGFNAGEYDTAAMPGTYDRGTGEEEFGFMAYPARQTIAELPKDTPPRAFYYMDGSPSAADVWLPTGDTEAPSDGTWNDWRTVLIGGMRQGGPAIWALDVTNPPDHDSPGGEQASGPGYPGYLWEFPCEAASCDAWRPYMGETWSQPVITRVKATVNCGDDSSWSNCATYDRWIAVFGGGYDASGDPNMTHDTDGTVVAGEYDPGTDADTKLAGRALFAVDIATGEVLAAKRFQYDGSAGDPTDGEPGMRYAIPSRPSVFDLDFDGYGDAVYVGDLGGNVWKWVIHPPAEDHIRGSSGDDHQGRWEFLKILAAENCTSCSPKHYKSFFYPPTGAMVGQNLWLALGSGERNDLFFGQDGGLVSAQRNRYYVLKDHDPFELERNPATLPYTDVSPSQDFVDGTSITDNNPNTCLTSTSVGFYFEGEDGEKFVTDSVIFFGVVFTASYVPAPSAASACIAAGHAYLYGFDLLCGEGVFPPAGSGQPNQCRIEVGGGTGGLPNGPRVSVGPEGSSSGSGPAPPDPCTDNTDMVLVITSESDSYEDCKTQRPNSGLRVKSWRDF